MFTGNLLGSLAAFEVKKWLKSNFKPKKAVDNLATVVQDVKNLCASLEQFNDDFGLLNQNIGSDEWSQDAQSISDITDDIKSTFSTYCTRIADHVSDINTKIGQENTRLAGKVAENQSKFAGISQNISSITTN